MAGKGVFSPFTVATGQASQKYWTSSVADGFNKVHSQDKLVVSMVSMSIVSLIVGTESEYKRRNRSWNELQPS